MAGLASSFIARFRGDASPAFKTNVFVLAIGCALAGLASTAVIVSGPVLAAEPAASTTSHDYAISAGKLSDVLAEFAAVAGVQLVFEPQMLEGLRSDGLHGRHSIQEGFSHLLADSGYEAIAQAGGGYSLRQASPAAKPSPEPEEARLSPVTVTANYLASTANVMTEGTGSYTTNAVTIGKAPMSLRETPQSVSVVTRQQMDDQSITDVSDALRTVTGVTVLRQGTYIDSGGTARGNAVAFQVDGAQQHYSDFQSPFDAAIYDRVEVLRGPAGLLSGGAFSGATANLVRKRPQAERRIAAALGVGSWEERRQELDVTGALTDSGALRGRMVLVNEDKGEWRDNLESGKWLVNGALAYDLAERTTLTAGATRQRAEAKSWVGLPTYTDGRPLDLPRSATIYVTPWNRHSFESDNLFLELEHRLEGGGRVKLTAHRDERSVDMARVFPGAGVAANGTVPLTAQNIQRNDDATSADGFLDLPFAAWGQRHHLLLGFDYSESRTISRNRVRANYVSIDIQDFNPGSVPEPDWDTLSLTGNFHQTIRPKSYGSYGSVRLKALDRLTLIAGGRLSWWETETFNHVNGTTTGYDANAEFTPYGGVVYDLSRALSLYASYSKIFVPQNQLTVGGEQIKPRAGDQWEVGVKGEWLDGRLNAYTSIYRIQDENRALADPANPGFSVPAGKVRIQGVDAEISGELLPGWHLTAGYAYTDTEYLTGTAAQTGQPFAPTTPKHNFKLWSLYHFAEGTALHGLDVGGGLRAVSGGFYQNPSIVGKGYAVASLRLGYRLHPNVQAALNVENLFDRDYLERAGNLTNNNYYGAPRSFMLTLRGTW